MGQEHTWSENQVNAVAIVNLAGSACSLTGAFFVALYIIQQQKFMNLPSHHPIACLVIVDVINIIENWYAPPMHTWTVRTAFLQQKKQQSKAW